MTERAPATNRPRRYRSPCLLILPSLFLPPLECCFGTIPIQAEKLRPDRKDFGSATVATKAVASTGPTPGASSSLMLISLDRCQALISRSNSGSAPSSFAVEPRVRRDTHELSLDPASRSDRRRQRAAPRRRDARPAPRSR